MARGDARGALCRRRAAPRCAHHRRFPRYPFSPLTFNAFPERDWRAPPVPVASLGSTNFAKHRYKSFDNAHGPGRRYIQRGSRRRAGGGAEYEGYGKREREREGERGWVSWKFGDTPGGTDDATKCALPHQPVHRVGRTCRMT